MPAVSFFALLLLSFSFSFFVLPAPTVFDFAFRANDPPSCLTFPLTLAVSFSPALTLALTTTLPGFCFCVHLALSLPSTLESTVTLCVTVAVGGPLQ